jgi:phosphoribosylaminoimidazole-succinocarboxamide synthase
MVSTDRVSAYDVVMPNAIPGKGAILNQLSVFWFGMTKDIVPNHLINFAMDVENVDRRRTVAGRSTFSTSIAKLIRWLGTISFVIPNQNTDS